MEKVIDITAKREGFRRAGMQHSETTQTWPLDKFTPKQIKELQAEPMLVVAIRNADDTSATQGGQLDELKKQVGQLEGDIAILTGQEQTCLAQITQLTSQLDEERQKVLDLTAERDTGQANIASLTTELETERQKVADLTANLTAAEKKGK